jgi:hypothetical protein
MAAGCWLPLCSLGCLLRCSIAGGRLSPSLARTSSPHESKQPSWFIVGPLTPTLHLSSCCCCCCCAAAGACVIQCVRVCRPRHPQLHLTPSSSPPPPPLIRVQWRLLRLDGASTAGFNSLPWTAYPASQAGPPSAAGSVQLAFKDRPSGARLLMHHPMVVSHAPITVPDDVAPLPTTFSRCCSKPDILLRCTTAHARALAPDFSRLRNSRPFAQT